MFLCHSIAKLHIKHEILSSFSKINSSKVIFKCGQLATSSSENCVISGLFLLPNINSRYICLLLVQIFPHVLSDVLSRYFYYFYVDPMNFFLWVRLKEHFYHKESFFFLPTKCGLNCLMKLSFIRAKLVFVSSEIL